MHNPLVCKGDMRIHQKHVCMLEKKGVNVLPDNKKTHVILERKRGEQQNGREREKKEGNCMHPEQDDPTQKQLCIIQ